MRASYARSGDVSAMLEDPAIDARLQTPNSIWLGGGICNLQSAICNLQFVIRN